MVRWVPFHRVPLKRRLQTSAILLNSLLPFISLGLFVVLLFFPIVWPFLIAYIGWIAYDQAPRRGGRPIQWIRKLRLFRYMAEYFPVSMVKEEELDPKKRYVFGYHPHGIISHGAAINFGSEGTNFSKFFNGLSVRLLTLDTNFRTPFYRDWLLALGIASVSLPSCNAILNLKEPTSIVIVVGGAAEALDAHANTNVLTLRRRKGFVKVAIRNGASLVPIFSFGENDLYNTVPNPKGSSLRKFQENFQKLTGVSPPVFYGRGIFNYDYGMLPIRKEIHTVFGKAIETTKTLEPSEQYVDEVHDKYIAELQRIYDKHKDKFAPDRKKDLVIA